MIAGEYELSSGVPACVLFFDGSAIYSVVNGSRVDKAMAMAKAKWKLRIVANSPKAKLYLVKSWLPAH